MRTKQEWLLVQVAPLAAGVLAMSALPSRAAELSFPSKTDGPEISLSSSTESTIPAPTPLAPSTDADGTKPTDSDTIETKAASFPYIRDEADTISPKVEEPIDATSMIGLQPWVEHDPSNTQTSFPSISEVMPKEKEPQSNQLDSSAIARTSASFLSEITPVSLTREDLGYPQFIQFVIPTPDSASTRFSVSRSEIQIPSLAPVDGVPVSGERLDIAQSDLPPEIDAVDTQSEPEELSSAPRWRFTVSPYAFVPLNVGGSATVRDYTEDLNVGLDDILNSLNFAAAGRLEAWRGNIGLVLDAAYFNVGQENSSSLSTPDCLCDIFPSEIDTDVNVQYGQFDLGVGYRVSANASGAATEFELGPIVFDAIAGIRIYAFEQSIDISTNLGTERNLSEDNILVTPLLSGRFRWNVSPKVAGWARADLAGLGLGGTLIAVSVTAGVDWMFSGNTSLLLAYRLSSIQYETTIGDEAFNLNLFQHGPFVGVSFRF